jgi:hypothetical protein
MEVGFLFADFRVAMTGEAMGPVSIGNFNSRSPSAYGRE